MVRQRTQIYETQRFGSFAKQFSGAAEETLQQALRPEGKRERRLGDRKMAVGGASPRWGYVRIITGTILGGVLGFYVMHRVEISYKEKMKERLREYEAEMKRKQQQLSELDDSV
ncbi:uncharacterized protein LOC116187648 [Punica granatum]|uniref:Uncharacterized protein LOC116187648 n=2 Tax=Punica granatum TaxID=22663 RepID=A0A6P8BPW1_PUNGR|nr:uncharacterized protein LOC116187648 [Punica granatum]PKI70381.1 hypothetical protein CRG98_009261 [Punica granatum]